MAAMLCGVCAGQSATGWPVYNGGLDGDHYSTLKQINRANVGQLKVAWRFDTGETGGIQTNPLVVGHSLFAYTPTQKVVALDAATGALKWKFDSGVGGNQPARGLAYWTDGKQGRIFAGIMNFLYCLDAETGRPIESFGEAGRVDLRKDLRGNYEEQSVVLTTPGVIYKDMIIVGGRNPETHPAPPGDIRAFDVVTGKMRWSFHTIPATGRAGCRNLASSGCVEDCGRRRITGRGWLWMRSAELCMRRRGRRCSTFMAGTGWGMTSTPIRCWRWMRIQVSGCGIFRACITTFGIATFRPGRRCLHSSAMAKRCRRWRRLTKQGYLYLFSRISGQPLFPIL